MSTRPSLESARAALARIDERHEEYYDTLLDEFTRDLNEQVVHSIATLTSELRSTLSFDKKKRVESTWANRQILSHVDRQFEGLLRRYGISSTINKLVNQFPGQLPFLREEFAIINSVLRNGPLVEGALLTGTDLDVLLSQQELVRGNLVDIAATVGDLARRKILLSVNALDVGTMTEMLSKSLNRTTEESRTIAATSAAMFYRTAYSRVIDRIEQTNTEVLRYKYDGPRDRLNRPFCRHLVDQSRRGRSWTRAEFEAMNNEQLPNPFLTAGGFNCRHQPRIDLGEELG